MSALFYRKPVNKLATTIPRGWPKRLMRRPNQTLRGPRVRQLAIRRPAPESGMDLTQDRVRPISMDGLGAEDGGGGWTDVFRGITQGVTNLTSAYVGYEDARMERKSAERQAREAYLEEQHRRALASEDAKQAEWELRMLEQQMHLQRQQQATGLPGWVIPVGVVGAGVAVFFLMRKK